LQRYEHGGDIYSHENVRLDYSVNLNPLGMPPGVREAIISRVGEYETYPDVKCRALRKAIAARDGVPEEYVLCGNGAADLIHRLCLALRPKRVLTLAPSFSEYERSARLYGSEIAYHRLSEAESFALTERVLDDITPETGLLFLCNPNNPTGRLIDANLMGKIARRCSETGTLLLLDECFLPFTDGASLLPLTERMPNLVLLRAFTKLYSMAGLRLGYIVCSGRELLKAVGEHAQCWSVSAVAQTAGLAALRCDGWEEKTRTLVSEEREYLSHALRALGLTVYPSDCNYLLFRSELPLYEPLLQKGVLIRRCENFEGLDVRFFRVGVKLRPQNEALVRAISEVLHG
jgi:threonine-phosphate decarboxylase